MQCRRTTPRLEALEARALLDAAGLRTSALIAPGDTTPAVTSTYWIATREGGIARPGVRDTVVLPLTADRVSSPGSKGTLFEIRVAPTDGGTFLPRTFALTGPDGKPVTDVAFHHSGAATVGIVRLRPGVDSVRVRGRGDSTGSFLVEVHLVGDVNGDRKVDQADLNIVRSALGSASTVADVNGDGRVGAADAALVRHNLGTESTTIQYLIRNDTGAPDSAVHVAFYGKDANGRFIYYDENGTQHILQADLAKNPLIPGSTTQRYVYNFTLDKAPGGIEIPRTDVINSGPILLGVGADVIAPINTSGGTVVGVAPPSPNNATDLNNGHFYQLAEVTQNYPTTLPPFVNLDTSVVDQFGLPLTLQLAPADIKVPDGVGVYPSRAQVIQDFTSGAVGAQAAFQLDVTRSGTATDPVGMTAEVPYRLLAPQDVLSLAPPTDPMQLAQYHQLNSYFDGAIDQFFTKYRTETLTLDSGAASSVPYRATVKTITQPDIHGNSQSYEVIQFTGGNAETYNVYYPYFSTNTPADRRATTLYGAAGPPPPPQWWAPGQPAGSLDTAESASAMVFACNGVFADNAFQPAPAYSGSAPTLANLENQIVSALNRGVATTQVIQTGSIDAGLTPSDGLYTASATVQDNTQLTVGMNVRGPGTNGPLVVRSLSATNPTAITLSSFTPIYPVNPQPLTFATYYAPGGTWNYYAGFFHNPAVSLDSLAYGFPYDDQGGTSTDISTNAPTQVILNLGWKTPLKP